MLTFLVLKRALINRFLPEFYDFKSIYFIYTNPTYGWHNPIFLSNLQIKIKGND